MNDIFFDLYYYRGINDHLGLKNDSVASIVTAKLNNYIDSITGPYTQASEKVQNALHNTLQLCKLECFITKYATFQGTPDWETELKNLRTEIDFSSPQNSLSYHCPLLFRHLYSIDSGNNIEWFVPDSLITPVIDYALNNLSSKVAEAVIGDILYNDGIKAQYSPSVPIETERYESNFPQSPLIPVLKEYATKNKLFNHPEDNSDIRFIDNAKIKKLSDVLNQYKGTPVLIDLWATWCRPCIAGFSRVATIQKFAKENGIKLLYISIDEDPSVENRWKSLAIANNLVGDHFMINPDIKMEIFDTFGENQYLGVSLYAVVDRDGGLHVLPQSIAEIHDFEPLRKELRKILKK